MCGRTACTLSPDVLCQACSYKRKAGGYSKPEWRESSDGKEYKPSFNFAPTFYGPVMISKRHVDSNSAVEDRVIQPMMWGMIPRWHEGTPTKFKMTTNNCRIEGLTESKLYKDPLMKGKHCVVLCDGFYEWKKLEAKGEKQPYFIYFQQFDGISLCEPKTWEDHLGELWSNEEGWKGPKPLTMAGLFDVWKSPEDGSTIYSYSVVTMDSCPAFSWIHERMPAILETEDDINSWLDFVHVPVEEALSKLKASSILKCHPVSTDVNYVRNQCDNLTRPIDLTKPKPLSRSGQFMANWLKKTSSTSKSVKEENASHDTSPKREGVKRPLSLTDEVMPTKKVKEENY